MDFVRNGWYVAAPTDKVSRQPIVRQMLGEPVLLYRTEGGAVVALSDRCPHRFAPLHQGRLQGDAIECPYHGLQFDPSGACSANPHGDHAIPRAAQVRRYPVVERDGVVWAWMGDEALADAGSAPDLGDFLGQGAMTVIGSELTLEAHYECVLDNLLDLSHAPFLHPNSLASADAVKTLRFEMRQQGDTVYAFHHVPDGPPAAQFAPFWDASAPLCDTHAHMRWDPPANLQLDVGITRQGRPDAEGLFLHIAHLLTPIDAGRTRYTWLAARNFEIGNDEVSAVMTQQLNLAFAREDEPMIEAVHRYMGTPDLMALSPVLLPGDAAGVRARRILQQLRSREG